MGANVSTNVSKMQRSIENSMTQSCTPKAGVTQTISGNKIVLRDGAKCRTIAFKNTARAESTCDMGSASKVLAEYSQKLTKDQKAGIGINISTNISETEENIKNHLEQTCGASASAVQEMSNNEIEIRDNAQCDAIEFMNEADLTATCVMKQVNDVTSNIIKETHERQAGWDPLGSLGLGALGPLAPLSSLFLSCSPCVSSILLFCCLILLMFLPNLMPQPQQY
jgi:hypothetical protein